jgi:hypothetical protein
MRPNSRSGRLRAALLCAALAACLALPAAASADTTGDSPGVAHVTVDPAVHVTAKLVAVVDVSITCDPFLVYDWETGTYVESTVGHLEGGGVSLSQASGRRIASASGEVGGGTVVCDGQTATTRSISIMAYSSPWKSGTAIATARLTIYADGFGSYDLADSGPVVVKLGK